MEELEVNAAVELLYKHLDHIILTHVPKYPVRGSSYPPWFSRELKNLTWNKKATHRRYKATNCFSDYLAFSGLRTQCNSLASKCLRGYVEVSERAIAGDARSFWGFVNSMRVTKNCLPAFICNDDSYSSDSSVIANCFAKFFELVYSVSSVHNCPMLYESVMGLGDMDITIGEIFECMNTIQLHSSPGIDNIPPVFFKSCKFIMSRVLWLIFNKSLSCGIFPEMWKQSIVTPVFKGGDGALVSNYRPISKQNFMPKIFENIIASKLSSLFKNILIEEQHGFVAGRSVLTNLLIYQDFLSLRGGLRLMRYTLILGRPLIASIMAY